MYVGSDGANTLISPMKQLKTPEHYSYKPPRWPTCVLYIYTHMIRLFFSSQYSSLSVQSGTSYLETGYCQNLMESLKSSIIHIPKGSGICVYSPPQALSNTYTYTFRSSAALDCGAVVSVLLSHLIPLS